MKTSELAGAALDWAVAKCEGVINGDDLDLGFVLERGYTPSTDWAQGGPIIEKERITVIAMPNGSWATSTPLHTFHQPTPLIAAMRCYVTSNLGEEIDIPKELL